VLAALALVVGALTLAAPPAGASVRHLTILTVSCLPNPVEDDKNTTCTVKVNGTATDRPTGIVGFTSSRGSGFSPKASCTLAPNTQTGAPVNQAICSVQYNPPGVGTTTRKDVITAQYLGLRGLGGDPKFRTASRQTTVSVTAAGSSKPKPTIDLFCNDPIPAGTPGTCNVVLEDLTPDDLFDSPTGTVTFKSSRPKGMNAGNSSCTLVHSTPTGIGQRPYSSCSMTYIPPDAGYPTRVDTITANYAGDADNGSATESFNFSVPKPAL
jgi:hypothetical protein